MIRKTLSMAFVALFIGVAVTLAGLDTTPILNASFESVEDGGTPGGWGYIIDDWYENEHPARTSCFYEKASGINLVGEGDLWVGNESGGKFYQSVGTVDNNAEYEITALIGARWGSSFRTGSFSLYASTADAATNALDGVELSSFATLLSTINVTTNNGVATGNDNVWTVSVNLPTRTGHAGEVLWLEFGSVTGKDYFDNIAIAPSAAATPPAPVWTDPVTSSTGVLAVAYSDTLAGKAIDAAGDVITYGITTSPAWLSVAPDGSLSGTPDTLGENTFTVTASDGTGTSSTTLTLFVRASEVPEWTEPVTSGAATINEPYSGNLEGKATDPDGQSISYSLTDTGTWLDVASDGTLSGQPSDTDEGTNTFTVVADDGLDAPVSTTLTIVVIKKDYTIAWNFSQRRNSRMVQGDGEIFGTSQWTDSVDHAAPEWTSETVSTNEWAITTPQNVTMVSVAWAAGTTWHAGNETTLEDQLFKRYLDDGGSIGPMITVSGMSAWMTAAGASGYEVTFYQNSDAANNNFAEVNIYEGEGLDGEVLESFPAKLSDGSGSGGGSRLIQSATQTFTTDVITFHTKKFLGGGNRASFSAFKITPILIPTAGEAVTDLVISGPYAGGMELSWTGENGKPYGVETNDNLIITSGWASWITNQVGNGGTIAVTNAIGPNQTFYRVISEVPE